MKKDKWNSLRLRLDEALQEGGQVLAVILILAGVLLLAQFLIVIIGPLCIALGAWYLWNEDEDKSGTE